MKFKVVAMAISASLLLTSGVVNAAEVYNKNGNKLDLNGRVTGLHYFSENEDYNRDATFARLGFSGETQINDSLIGYGKWEYQFNANNAERNGSGNDRTRLAYAGLKYSLLGSIDYGRNYGVAYDVGAWTDVLPEWGGDTWTHTDNFMTKRTTGVLTWRNTDFFGLVDGLNVAAQYQGKNERGEKGNDLRTSNGDGWGVSTTYTYDGFGVALAYTNSDRTDAQARSEAKGNKAEVWAAGLKYDANDLYLAATYAEALNMTVHNGEVIDETQNIELVAQYQFDFGLRPSVAYLSSKGKDIPGVSEKVDLVEYVSLGATYYFNKNMSTYVDYRINLIDEDRNYLTVNTDDVVAVGLIYQF